MALYDDQGEDEDTRRARREQPEPQATQGYRPGIWSNDYDPGPNWNGGTAPPGAGAWNMTTNSWTMPEKQATAVDYPGAAPAPQPTAAPAPAFQPAAQAPQATPAPPASVAQPGITDEVTKILMARLKELQNPGDVASDPIYMNAVKQYQIGQLRSAAQQRKALAERSAATSPGAGTRSGGFNVGVQGINERSGENAAQYRSGLALDRLGAREQQLNQAIQMARAVGQDDIANQLEVQRLQLQSELGRGDLALRGELGRGNLGLGQDQLGFSYADLITRANRDATLAALRGGG